MVQSYGGGGGGGGGGNYRVRVYNELILTSQGQWVWSQKNSTIYGMQPDGHNTYS